MIKNYVIINDVLNQVLKKCQWGLLRKFVQSSPYSKEATNAKNVKKYNKSMLY